MMCVFFTQVIALKRGAGYRFGKLGGGLQVGGF